MGIAILRPHHVLILTLLPLSTPFTPSSSLVTSPCSSLNPLLSYPSGSLTDPSLTTTPSPVRHAIYVELSPLKLVPPALRRPIYVKRSHQLLSPPRLTTFFHSPKQQVAQHTFHFALLHRMVNRENCVVSYYFPGERFRLAGGRFLPSPPPNFTRGRLPLGAYSST